MAVRIALYVIAIALPLAVSIAVGGLEDDPLSVVTAVRLALIGLTIMTLQFVLASRSKWIERGIGLDTIFRFHRAMAICAVTFLVAHPVLLAAGFNHWELLTSFKQRPPVLIGKLTLLVLLTLAVTSVYRLSLRIGFAQWRKAHNILAATALALGCFHALNVGQARHFPAFKLVPLSFLVVAICAYVYDKLISPSRAARSPYTVVEVSPETADVTTLKLAPTRNRIEANVPGQFAFIRFLKGSDVLPEEHHFTISSAPSESGILTFTIKNSGDFTARIGDAKPGDLVAVQGPFGAFSNAFHQEDKDLVFIAGGIGITPIMSMIRGMKAASADRDMLLIYGNETEGEIVFRDELDEMAGSDRPHVRVVHVLNKPDDGWQGARGYINRDLILGECGTNLGEKAFYLCGPVVMMDLARRILRESGVPGKRIHWEKFSL